MAAIPKRFVERAKQHLRRYQRILETARSRDLGESDTVVIVTDFLNEILGYAKYDEITTEHAIRSTFCDIAIKVDGRLQFLIEVKAIGTDLKDNHLRQAIDYASKEGAEWVLLTNGAEWQAHRVHFERPIRHELVLNVDLLDSACKPSRFVEQLFLISREACSGGAIEKFWQQKEATSRFVLAQLLLCRPTLSVVRRGLRRLSPGLKVSEDQLEVLLRAEVLKRDVLEGDRVQAAEKLVRRMVRRRERAGSEETAATEKGIAPSAGNTLVGQAAAPAAKAPSGLKA